MKMLHFAFSISVLCFVAGGVKCGYEVDAAAPIKNLPFGNCKVWQTECVHGCCPFANGVCCSDLMHCCPQGTSCIPLVGKCVRSVNDSGQMSLESEKATDSISSVSKCPPGYTECEPNKCCPYKQAVCCKDSKHCCPNGTKCDLTHMRCIRDKDGTSFEKPFRTLSAKSPYKFCPGGNGICPGRMNCCINDNGDWGCCLNATVHKTKYGARMSVKMLSGRPGLQTEEGSVKNIVLLREDN